MFELLSDLFVLNILSLISTCLVSGVMCTKSFKSSFYYYILTSLSLYWSEVYTKLTKIPASNPYAPFNSRETIVTKNKRNNSNLSSLHSFLMSFIGMSLIELTINMPAITDCGIYLKQGMTKKDMKAVKTPTITWLHLDTAPFWTLRADRKKTAEVHADPKTPVITLLIANPSTSQSCLNLGCVLVRLSS